MDTFLFQGEMYHAGPGLMHSKVNQYNYYASGPRRLKLFLALDTFLHLLKSEYLFKLR